MAKPKKHKCPKCPKCLDPVEIVRGTVKVLLIALFPGGDPETIMEKLRDNGTHHELMELAWPETDDMEGDEYGGALDEFEGDLSTWLEEAAEWHATEQRRRAARDRS